MTKQLLFIGVLLAGLGGGAMWWIGSQKPQGEYIAVGFGEPIEPGVPIELAVTMIMPKLDPPKIRAVVQWEEWIDSHFTCTSENGEKVAFRRVHFSQSIPGHVAGTPEFFITGYVKPGVKYSFEYAPILSEPRRLRYDFTAPSAKQAGERVLFQEVE